MTRDADRGAGLRPALPAACREFVSSLDRSKGDAVFARDHAATCERCRAHLSFRAMIAPALRARRRGDGSRPIAGVRAARGRWAWRRRRQRFLRYHPRQAPAVRSWRRVAVDDADAVFKKQRQVPADEVAILVDGGGEGQHGRGSPVGTLHRLAEGVGDEVAYQPDDDRGVLGVDVGGPRPAERIAGEAAQPGQSRERLVPRRPVAQPAGQVSTISDGV